MDEKINEPALLEAMARAGETPPSRDQLKRWRREGLMPRPDIQHPRGVRGSRALYPGWAVDQLLAVIRLHSSIHRVRDLCVELWWEGHWVRPDALRDALISPLEQISDEARAMRGEESDVHEAADAMVTAIQSKAKSPPPSVIRRRLNDPADLMSLLWTFLVIGLGGQAPWEQEDQSLPDPAPKALDLVTVAVGADRAMRDDLMGEGPLVPHDFDMPGFLGELRDVGGFEFEDMAGEIRDAKDQELEQAREDAQLLCGPLAQICSVLEDLLGDDVAGLGSLRMLEDTTTIDRAELIRSMLVLRRLAGDAAFVATRKLVDEEGPRYAAIAEFRAGLPQYEELLRLDFEEQLSNLSPSEAERVQKDIERFLQSRPEVAAALSDDGD